MAGIEQMDVGFRELAAFVVLAEEGSFTRSARRLHLSQPGMSARIVRLEKAVGVRLLDRTTRSVELTRAGRQFLPAAEAALRVLAAGCELAATPPSVKDVAAQRVRRAG